MSTVTGWKAAAAYVGDTSPMRLRRLVQREELQPIKNAEGMYEFRTADLDLLRRQKASEDISAVKGPMRPPPSWLTVAEPSEDDNDLDAEVEEQNHEASTPMPLGPASTWLDEVTEGHPEIAYVQTPMTTATIAAAIEPWRVAWRRERVAQIAHAIAIEAATAGASLYAAWCASCAAGAAVEQLDDARLGDDAWAWATARAAGQHAAAWVAWQQAQVAAWQAEMARQQREEARREREDDNDVDRARARRRWRSPRA